MIASVPQIYDCVDSTLRPYLCDFAYTLDHHALSPYHRPSLRHYFTPRLKLTCSRIGLLASISLKTAFIYLSIMNIVQSTHTQSTHIESTTLTWPYFPCQVLCNFSSFSLIFWQFLSTTLVAQIDRSIRCTCLSVHSDNNLWWTKWSLTETFSTLSHWPPSTSSSKVKVKVIGQSSRSQDKKNIFLLWTHSTTLHVHPVFSELTFTFATCCRPSACRLSSVTFVRSTQAIQIFGSISTALGTLAIRWHSVKILRRSSQGSPSAGWVKHKRGSQV